MTPGLWLAGRLRGAAALSEALASFLSLASAGSVLMGPSRLARAFVFGGGAGRLEPPRVDLVAVKRGSLGPLQIAPMRDPLARQIKEGNDVIPREQDAVQRARGSDEARPVFGLEQRLDHGVHARAFHARKIERAFRHRGLAPPTKRLLIPRRQRHRPEILDHVEVVGLLAPLILGRINLTDSRLDSYLFQGPRIGEQQPLLPARRS